MKKAISISVLILFIMLIFQYVTLIFKDEHSIKYDITNNELTFNIEEKYKNNEYILKIDNDQNKFIFSFDNEFNKSKKIVTDIFFRRINDMLCIYPVLKNDSSSNIKCSNNDTIFSYNEIKNLAEIVEFKNYIVNNNYKSNAFIEDNTEYKNNLGVSFYQNMLKNEYITIWTYQGFGIVHNNSVVNKNILEFDRYENTLSRVVGKYYVTPNYIDNRLFEIDSFTVINIEDNREDTIKLENNLSNQSYVNGVVDNKLYIFDKNRKIQIEINPKEKKVREVGNMDIDCQYYSDKFETRNIYDFINSKIEFRKIDNTGLSFPYDEIYQNDDAYFLLKNNVLYRVYKEYPDIIERLCTVANMKEIQVVKNNIYFISNDTLYRYNDNNSLRKLHTYKEFKFNSSNIVGIYLK